MKINSLFRGSLFAMLVIPILVAEAFLEETGTIVLHFGYVVNLLIGALAAVALLAFIWGIVKYIAAAGDEKAAKEGKSIMIYGVIALFVLFSVWGLVDFIGREFGIPANNQMNQFVAPPRINF